MTKPHVHLITCDEYPHLEADDEGLLDALAERGVDPKIVSWTDNSVDWDSAKANVVRSVRNYATQRDAYIKWAKSVPRLLNQPDVQEWNSNKHYLFEMEKMGLKIVPTTWLDPGHKLSKHQIHNRFPAHGEFVVKPAISSGGRAMGRYSAIDSKHRVAALEHCMHLLSSGEPVMIQRYIESVDVHGETSMVYVNGILSHSVSKRAMLHPAQSPQDEIQDEVVTARKACSEDWIRGEEIRMVVHNFIRKRLGHDDLLLFNRIDIIEDGAGGYYVMEISMIDTNLYLKEVPGALDTFADAITMRAFW
ncbi:MAG: glutathione synthetase [Actinomycetaceae bacterium]|nr:glutathione synthetase [Actinomycetaceae bacterium]